MSHYKDTRLIVGLRILIGTFRAYGDLVAGIFFVLTKLMGASLSFCFIVF